MQVLILIATAENIEIFILVAYIVKEKSIKLFVMILLWVLLFIPKNIRSANFY